MNMDSKEAIEIVQRLSNCLNHDSCEKEDCIYFNKQEDINKLIDYMKDMAPVVRCKDCKWAKGKEKRTCELSIGKHEVFDIFYCFCGEKENETEETKV